MSDHGPRAVNGAADRIRTGDVQLGKLAFYQLNYARDNDTTYRAGEFAKRLVSLFGSTQSGRTKWQVYPFG